MPKQYKKGKSNRLTHKTSVWTLVAKSRFGAFEDLRSMKAKEKFFRSVETKPNIPKKIEPIVNESVDKKIEYDDLQAYQEQQKLEVEHLKKKFWQTSLYLQGEKIHILVQSF